MPVRPYANNPASEMWMVRVGRAWAVGAAAGCGVAGLVLMLAGAEEGPLWQRADALFGVSTRTVLRAGSLAHLLLAGYLAFARNPFNQALLAFCLGANYLVYRAGLAWLGVSAPLPVLECAGDMVGIRPQTLSTAWTWFTVYLLAGGLMVLWFEWRHWKRINGESFLRQWQTMRRQSGGGLRNRKAASGTAPTTTPDAEGGGA